MLSNGDAQGAISGGLRSGWKRKSSRRSKCLKISHWVGYCGSLHNSMRGEPRIDHGTALSRVPVGAEATSYPSHSEHIKQGTGHRMVLGELGVLEAESLK